MIDVDFIEEDKMKKNYILEDMELICRKDVDRICSFLKNCNAEDNSMYMDEVIINLFVRNETILKDCLEEIKKYRFGILRRLPLVNIYLNVNNVIVINDLNNNIQNFITPILQLDLSIENIIEKVKQVLCLFKEKGWKLQILLSVDNIQEFKDCIQWNNILKCEFFEDELSILFKFADDKELLQCAYINMNFVMDTLKFLGMRNNRIISCLLKAIREKETGVCQEYDNLYKDVIKKLMKLDVEKYYGKRTLIRETMDDFAIV